MATGGRLWGWFCHGLRPDPSSFPRRSLKFLAIVPFVLCLNALPIVAVELPSSSKTSNPQIIEYPPYPDVWDWYAPSTRGYPFSMYRLKNGDILIEYTKRFAGKGKKLENYAVTFFGRKVFAGDDARRAIEKAEKDMRQRGGGDLDARLNYMKYEAISPDGTWDIKEVYAYNLHCYSGPNRYPSKLTNTKTGQERIFTIFRLLDKPEEFLVRGLFGQLGAEDEEKEFPDATCLSERRRTVKYKVKSVSGDFLFLDDNSFLFHVEETGEVIRFDIDLKSKSALVGDRFFVIENKGGSSIMNLLTGKVYEDDVDPQVETDDLYRYLQSKRRK